LEIEKDFFFSFSFIFLSGKKREREMTSHTDESPIELLTLEESKEGKSGPYYVFPCPHCQKLVLVQQADINCEIFRHAVWKKNGEPIPPHAKKEEIEAWHAQKEIVGCGKPFRLTKKGELSVCGYI